MTSRSYESTSSRRSGKERVTDDDVYQYALRVGYLAYLMTPKVQPNAVDATNGESKDPNGGHHHGRLSNALGSFTDMFRDMSMRDGSRGVKFPDKLFKQLDVKMQNIAMGKDPQYSDQFIRRTVAVFWGSLKASEKSSSREPSSVSWRQIKDNRKIEELILFFVTTATQTLRKDPTLQGDAWKMELNTQISQFVFILRECVRNLNHVPPEIISRLEMYTSKLTDTPSTPNAGSSRGSVLGGVNTGTSSPKPTGSVDDMPLVKTIARLFGRADEELQRDVNAIKVFCTEKAALSDLKTCLKNINADMPFPGRRDDFDTQEGFNHWRTQELAHLSQLTMQMLAVNPELRNAIPTSDPTSRPYLAQRPSSVYSAQADGNVSNQQTLDSTSDDEIELGHNFTYIPPAPKKYYKRLLELCIQYDLEAMVHLPEDQEVSLTILSQRHLEVLNEATLRWRIPHSYRVVCFLDVIKYKYEREEVPLDCVPEALQLVVKAMQELDIEKWTFADIDYVSTVYGGLFNIFLGALYEALEDITKLKFEQIRPYVSMLESIQHSGLVERYKTDIDARLQDLADRVRVQAVHQYTDKNYELMSNSDPNRALPLLYLTDHLEKQAKLLDKRFPEPILGHLDLVSLALESQIPLFLTDLDHARVPLLEGARQKPPVIPLPDIFALYRRVKTLLSMHQAFCPKSPVDYDVASYFEPYVLQWLVNTDLQTAQWVYTAISIDKFEAEGPEGHSSSIIDLFENLKGPVAFIRELQWPDQYQEARFFTGLSKTVSKLTEEYCRRIEDLFMEEMFPRQQLDQLPSKQYAFFEKAKQAIGSEKKVEPFNFTPTLCVKLNNIDAARALLDKAYASMDVDVVSLALVEHGPPVPDKVDRPRFLFTVKVVQAENLVPGDASPSAKVDSFVTLSDQQGYRLAKTRTIYQALGPRWDETFDISVEKSLWVMASVCDRAIVGKHDVIGRETVFLDPHRYGDYLAHDVWLELERDKQHVGRLLLRISMEGEKDDPQFYFGRAFRSLKRAEADMIRVIIDKIVPLLRQHVNRSVLKDLLRTTLVGYDYNKALTSVTGFYRSAIGADKADSLIPAISNKEKLRYKPEGLSDEEIESALVPLFDYFDANLAIFNSYLSTATKDTVMMKMWKEILATIEDLLVPLLSSAPSDMKQLADKEVDIVFKWLKFFKDYMNAGGEGVPLEQLQNQRYRDILSIRLYYDWHTDDLMEECVRLTQQKLRGTPTVKKRAKTVYSQRNLGTIRERKKEKRQDNQQGNGDMILRILRMRSGTSDFIQQQIAVAESAQAEHEKRTASRKSNGRGRFSKMSGPPPMPPLPS